MSTPLVVNTRDGSCWTRRTVTAGGIALYAPEAVKTCPAFVMATLAELAEHGIVGSADALPMPMGPEPQPSDGFRVVVELANADNRSDADWAAELAENALEGQGFKVSATVAELAEPAGLVPEAALDVAVEELSAFLRVRLALESARRGRRELRAELHTAQAHGRTFLEQRNAHAKELLDLRARVAELEAAQQPAEGSSYPSALPWARLMDAEDLAEFLAEVEHAIATPGATPAEALAAVEKRCGTWRVIAEAQHAHNTAPGPDAEAGEPS